MIGDGEWPIVARAAASRLEAVRGMGDRGGVTTNDRLARIELGAAGEYVVAAAFGVPFDETPFGLDVGEWNVRTRSVPSYTLIIQDHDVTYLRGVPHILVTATAADERRAFWIRGWMTPGDAARPEWRHSYGDYKPAYFPPHAALRSLRALPGRRRAV